MYLEGGRKNRTLEELDELKVKESLKIESIDRVVFIPIKSFGRVTTVCEVFLSEKTDFDSSMLDQCEVSSYQIGSILEGNENRKKIEKNYIEIKSNNKKIKKAQSQLVQSEKMASLGILAAGIAHEINNPIGFVMSNIGTMKEYLDPISNYIRFSTKLASASNSDVSMKMKELDNEENFDFIMKDMKDIIGDCDDGLVRIKDIAANLKAFSRVDEKEKTMFNINACIDHIIKVIWNELKYNIELTRNFSKKSLLVKGHEGQIGQVVMNILINAAHAIEGNGKIDIVTKVSNKNLKILISDTGRGMSDKIKERIFDPFFTTKSVDKGTGLGLSVSYGIIENHGGEINIESVEGEGTTFEISLPMVE